MTCAARSRPKAHRGMLAMTVVDVFPEEVKEAASAPFGIGPHGLADIEMGSEAIHEDVLQNVLQDEREL